MIAWNLINEIHIYSHIFIIASIACVSVCVNTKLTVAPAGYLDRIYRFLWSLLYGPNKFIDTTIYRM